MAFEKVENQKNRQCRHCNKWSDLREIFSYCGWPRHIIEYARRRVANYGKPSIEKKVVTK